MSVAESTSDNLGAFIGTDMVDTITQCQDVAGFLSQAVALAGDKMSSTGISGLSYVLMELHRSLEYAGKQS